MRQVEGDATLAESNGGGSQASVPAPQGAMPARIADRYRIEGEIGRGGMARVYGVIDESSGRRLALKLLMQSGGAAHRLKIRSLFEREYHTLAQLSHPRVIEVYDYGVDEAGPYYTMELLEGGDLRGRCPLPWREACELAFDVCSSLALLHSRRLIHRDISPRNVRFTRENKAKLIDFGAMAAMGPSRQVVGTPAFVAPEVVNGASLDARTDLFSLGATLYFALTGRVPFRARSFAEVAAAWAVQPVLPSLLSPEIPAELDALVMSLLGIEPVLRPRTAFEVMQRLAGIARLEGSEPLSVSRAYLATPVMVGREALLVAFRTRMQRALAQRGGGLLFEGSAGLGRTRLLDACALEAKTLGAVVLRTHASGTRSVAFSGAQILAEALVQALPAQALATAREHGVFERLFEAPASECEQAAHEPTARAPLKTFAATAGEQLALQAALSRWILQLSRSHPLLIAVDDADAIDEPSLALLAALAHDARRCGLLVVATAQNGGEVVPLGLQVLADRCRRIGLRALDLAETETLFRSLFDDVPNVGLLSSRVHAVAGGRPRECMALARHLLESGRISYAGGSWTLPEQLAAAELPASVREMLHARIAKLSPLARFLAGVHALSIDEALTREDYAALRADSLAEQVDEAITQLIAHELLICDGVVYSLPNRELRAELIAALDDDARRQRHHALALLCEHSGRPAMMSVHHLFAAGLGGAALDRLMPLLRATRDWVELMAAARMPPTDTAQTMERALDAAERQARPPRELCDLRCWLMLLSVTADDRLYWRTAPALLVQLRHDSGLDFWRELAHLSDPAARLMQALQRAAEQYAATPEAERVYNVEQAIRFLVSYAAASIPIGARTLDARLLNSVPPLLEPFAALSPVLDAMWQNAIAAREAICERRPERARLRWIDVYERLGATTAVELQGVHVLRNAIAFGICSVAAQLGLESAATWAETLDQDPLQRVNAMYMRKIIHLQRGDFDGAERCRRHAELLAVQATTRQVFNTLAVELVAHAAARDLTGLKQVKDRIAPLAERHAGWRPYQVLGEGFFARLRGDLEAARAAFELALSLSAPDPADPDRSIAAWPASVAAYVEAMVELGRYAEAKACGERALAMCVEREIGVVAHEIARALALAEAKLNDCAGAAARLEALIEEQRQLGVTGLHLGASYEARARVGIWAGDGAAVERYAALTACEYRRGRGSPLGTQYERLMREAHSAGMHAPQLSEFGNSTLSTTATVLGHSRTGSSVAKAMSSAGSALARAECAIALLCDAYDAGVGHLYLLAPDGEANLAASFGAESPSDRLRFEIGEFIRREREDASAPTQYVADTNTALSSAETIFSDERGTRYRPVLLSSHHEGAAVDVGVAVLRCSEHSEHSVSRPQLAAALAAQLLQAGDTRGARADSD